MVVLKKTNALMIYAVLTIVLGVFLSACVGEPAEPASGSPSKAEAETETPSSEYKDARLCFSVEVPQGWTTDGVPGGFASFKPAGGQASYRITNMSLEEVTLKRALDDVKRGALGTHIREIKDLILDGQPALWISFSPTAEFPLAILVIAPDCGDGPHALIISAEAAEPSAFEAFLRRIHFISPSGS